MKISKSKQELARIISENGGWCDGAEWTAQQDDGEVWFCTESKKPVWNKGRGTFIMGYEDHFTIGTLINNRHQCILSRAEYFHLYPAPDADGWIEWNGGECPVGIGLMLDVKNKSGECFHGVEAGRVVCTHDQCWTGHAGERDIIAYRLHKPEQSTVESRLADAVDIVKSAATALMRDDMKFTGYELMGERKPTIEQLAADSRNAKDYAERKQQEADAANADAEAKLKALEIAGEALYLIVTPIAAKQEPDLVITDWRDLIDGDVIRVDSVEASEDIRDALQGVESVVVTDLHMTGCVTNENYPGGESWWLGGPAETKWRFIRRQ